MHLNALRWQDPRTWTFLGSPSITRTPDGALLATHDYFGPGCPRNHEDEEHLTSVYRSEDDGQHWANITHIANAYWSSLFTHRDAVYLLGCSQQYGSIVIRRSTDGGYTWTHPRDDTTGRLFPGGYYHDAPNYHGAPVPVLVSGGRIYRAFEDCDPCVWGRGFRSCVISAPVDADLLDASNWTMSNRLAFNPSWVPDHWGPLDNPGWLEGNCVEAPDGQLVNILRFNSEPLADKAALVTIHEEGRRVAFDPETGFIDFPGGITKFSIRRDPVSGRYITFSNPNTDVTICANQRNRLAICSSSDLRTWTVHRWLLWDDQGMDERASRQSTGFQYVDWLFDGKDILYLVRTAYRGAHNFHDSNQITFHVLPDYMNALSEEVTR